MKTMYVNEESGELLATVCCGRGRDETIEITVSPHIQELLGRCVGRSNLPEQVVRSPFFVHHYRDGGQMFVEFPPTFSTRAQADAALATLGGLAKAAEDFLRAQ